MIWAALFLAVIGFGCIALSMAKHQRELLRRALPSSTMAVFRAAGAALLGAAAGACVSGWGPSVGLVLWFGILTAAALPVVMLSYARRYKHS